MITVSLETLKTGTLRATGRQDGRTVCMHEGGQTIAASLVMKALRESAPHHSLPNGGFDMTDIRLNEAAKVAIYPR